MPPAIGLTQRVSDLPDRGERRDALDQRWAALLEAAGLVPVPVPNALADPVAFVVAAGVQLLVLTGGNDLAALPGATDTAPERDRTEARLLDHAAATGLPVLGVCRGMQMLVHHLGGRLERVDGHVAVDHAVTVTPGTAWPLAPGRTVNSFHGWGVRPDGLGPDLVALAHAPDGTVEAVGHRSLPQVGIMWHPERPHSHPADLELVRSLLDRTPTRP